MKSLISVIIMNKILRYLKFMYEANDIKKRPLNLGKMLMNLPLNNYSAIFHPNFQMENSWPTINYVGHGRILQGFYSKKLISLHK